MLSSFTNVAAKLLLGINPTDQPLQLTSFIDRALNTNILSGYSPFFTGSTSMLLIDSQTPNFMIGNNTQMPKGYLIEGTTPPLLLTDDISRAFVDAGSALAPESYLIKGTVPPLLLTDCVSRSFDDVESALVPAGYFGSAVSGDAGSALVPAGYFDSAVLGSAGSVLIQEDLFRTGPEDVLLQKWMALFPNDNAVYMVHIFSQDFAALLCVLGVATLCFVLYAYILAKFDTRDSLAVSPDSLFAPNEEVLNNPPRIVASTSSVYDEENRETDGDSEASTDDDDDPEDGVLPRNR